MKKGEMLNFMIVTATNAFAGKYDKGGKPYILHCLAVMYLLNSDDEELNCIAVGHDLFEDTNVTAQYLRENGVTERVVAGIFGMTKMPGQSHDEYKAQVMSNHDSVQVKKADITHNSDIRRLKGVRDKDIERMVKYHHFYIELEEHERSQKQTE